MYISSKPRIRFRHAKLLTHSHTPNSPGWSGSRFVCSHSASPGLSLLVGGCKPPLDLNDSLLPFVANTPVEKGLPPP